MHEPNSTVAVSHFWDSELHQVHFVLEGDGVNAQLKQKAFHLFMPESIQNFDAIHPDRWALVLAMAVPPDATDLALSFSVSQAFHDAMLQGGIAVGPVSKNISPFEHVAGGSVRRPGVAFNGGVHAFIAAAVMGKDAVLFAVDHDFSSTQNHTLSFPTHTDPIVPDSMYHAMDVMVSSGYAVKSVRTNVQLLHDPPGFGGGLLSGLAAILLGGHFEIGSVCYGSHLASLPSLHGTDIRHITFKRGNVLECGDEGVARGSLRFWQTAFRAAGLELDFPTCGATDFLAMKLLSRHRMLPFAAICKRSYPPCECCADCIYYQLMRTMQTTHVPFDKAWDTCKFECAEMCTPKGRFAFLWALLLTRKDTAPPAIWKALSPHKAAVQAGKDRLHPGTLTVASALNRDKIRAGWQRLLGE